MTTFVIGDSHTRMFEKLPNVIIIKPDPPPTMYGLINENSKSQCRKKIFDTVNKMDKLSDKLILVVGEIDARIHIFNKHMTEPFLHPSISSIDAYIKKTIARYEIVLKELIEKEVIFYVCGIPPAGRQENVFNMEYYAHGDIRTAIYEIFHKELKKMCEKNMYNFIDIYTPFVEKNGFIKDEFKEDDIHLNYRFKNGEIQ